MHLLAYFSDVILAKTARRIKVRGGYSIVSTHFSIEKHKVSELFIVSRLRHTWFVEPNLVC